MSNLSTRLQTLSGGQAGAPRFATLPHPPRRWRTRVFVPVAIVGSAAALLAFAGRASWQPEIDVWVVPVVAKESTGTQPAAQSSATPPVVAQAPGWIEPDPFPITVPALAEGVIKEVRIVEGQRVAADDVVATMVDEDARLQAAATQAELGIDQADLHSAQVELEFQKINLERTRRLQETNAAADIELAGVQRDHDAAAARVQSLEARVARHQVLCAEAQLTLSRMEIRAPAGGVVMARLVEPGARISMAANAAGERMGAVARLYDPEKLQARVDVPLADATKVGIGTPAEVTTEALPDHTFQGVVTRLVHEANIQRNTVQVKVAISNPTAALKPEMLTRVRFLASTAAGGTAQPAAGQAPSTGGLRLLIPRTCLIQSTAEHVQVWVVDRSGGLKATRAALREIKIAGDSGRGYVQVLDGLRAGDRVLVEPPTALTNGAHIRVLGEKNAESEQE